VAPSVRLRAEAADERRHRLLDEAGAILGRHPGRGDEHALERCNGDGRPVGTGGAAGLLGDALDDVEQAGAPAVEDREELRVSRGLERELGLGPDHLRAAQPAEEQPGDRGGHRVGLTLGVVVPTVAANRTERRRRGLAVPTYYRLAMAH